MNLTRFSRYLGVLFSVVVLSSLLSKAAYAYSYAAAGKEPLIDGRETIMQQLASGDKAGAKATVASLHDELLYLEQHHNVTLIAPMEQAAQAGDAKAMDHLLNLSYRAEIERRLEGAKQNIQDYQTAKVLVVKSKKFLDLLQPALGQDKWQEAESALSQVLDSIGNPGVFGVGAKSADPQAFDAATKAVMTALSGL